MPKSFAQEHWDDFERLAFELTRDCFGITPTKLFRTRESKDGGFDSVFVHELGRLGETVIANETLMEAKLRSSSGAVGLRAFAATMIIAFNGRTNCLVVVTNREFSPQALKAARDFQWKSRLQVVLASQKTVSAWVRRNEKELASKYPRDLLADLILDDPADEIYEEVQIPGSDIVGTEPPARITFGCLPDGTISRPEIVFTSACDSAEAMRSVIGPARRRLVSELAETLSVAKGCAVVKGEAGAGKSHIVRAAVAVLAPHRRCLGLVDISQTATSRQLFLATLAQLIGIEVPEAARQFKTSDAKSVFSTVVGIPVPDEVTSAVLAILASPCHPDAREVDQIHLAEYLSFIARGGGAGARLLVFHNLDKAAAEVLEFLHAVLPILTANDVSVVVELAVGGDSPLIGLSHWKAFVDVFERAATLGCFLVPNLSSDEAVELLLEQMPGLGKDRALRICQRIGNRPLFLHHAALWLKRRNVVAERAQGIHLIEDPEVFFEGLRPEACLSILDRHIDLWRRDLELPYADAISAAVLLNGRLPVVAFQLILPDVRTESILDSLVATGLFLPEPELRGVRVSHLLLLERMDAIENGRVPGYGARRFDRKRVASLLLAGIDHLSSEGLNRELCRSALLAACEAWPGALESAQNAGRALRREHQLAMASEAFLRGVEAAEHLVAAGEQTGTLNRIYGLLDLLEVEDERYRLGLSDNEARLDALETAVGLFPLPEGSKHRIQLRILYLSWRAAFIRENFDTALRIAEELFRRACDSADIDPDTAGQAVSALGITLKATEQEDESKRVFDKGVALFPSSAHCRAQRLSNLAAFALRSDPSKALHFFRLILDKDSDGLTLLSRVHVEVDVAMAQFLMGHSTDTETQATSAINLADANGIPAEAARGRNILGCVYWRDGRTPDAINLFERAILDAERSYMERFLWRFRVNLACASAPTDPSVALASARWAEDHLLKSRQGRLKQLAGTSTHCTSRWYVALLAIGLVYDQCGADEDLRRLQLRLAPMTSFQNHLEELADDRFPSAVFAGTTHLQRNIIMITG